MTEIHAATGAFSYSGAAIASALLESGHEVRTLTGHPRRRPAGTKIDVRPLDFADRAGLVDSLRGARVLYNTYWVRFAHGGTDHARAVTCSRALFEAAAKAGVERIVHVSITNPSLDSPYPYFRGKAAVEAALASSGVSYAVLRPAILFGGDGVLLNNMAWLLRHLPVFAIGGDGAYRIRPIHVDDLAQLAVTAGTSRQDVVADAVGPDRPTFTELVSWIRTATASRAKVVHVPGAMLPPLATALRVLLRDVLLTRDEYGAMADGLADVAGPATGTTSVAKWIDANGETLGRTYANELRRHFR